MKTSDFYYHLPKEFIAQKPVHPRDSSRLLITAGVIYIIAQLFIPQGKTLSDIIPKWDNVSLKIPIKGYIILAILVSLLIEFLSDN